jgi:putative phosphoribosyl transferase
MSIPTELLEHLRYSHQRFADRAAAGRALAVRLAPYAADPQRIVLALPRGGVPVGFAVAEALDAPLDLVLVRKLGVPEQPELAMGAIAEGGVTVLNDEVVHALRISHGEIAQVAAAEQRELRRRAQVYRGSQPPPDLHGRVAILVDDGLATGTTMRAAIKAVRAQQPGKLVVAVPVAAPETAAMIRPDVDALVVLATPDHFGAVGLWYDDFAQTRDAEVCELLQQSRRLRAEG